MFCVIFAAIDDVPNESFYAKYEREYMIGEGKNIEEAFASVQGQINLSSDCREWEMTSIKYQKKPLQDRA